MSDRPACALPLDHPASREAPTLIYDSLAWVRAEDYDRLRAENEQLREHVEVWQRSANHWRLLAERGDNS